MKKILLLVMMCIPAVLTAQNGVTISNLVMEPGVVTFDVAWNKDAMPEPVWSDTVWVWVDYNNAGVMQRLPLSTGATLTATSLPGVGKVKEVSGNDKGVWVIGDTKTNSSFSATVRLLTAETNTAGACAYASNYRPRGKYTSDNDILFTGTPLYTVVLVPSGGGSPMTPMVGSSYRVPDGYTLQSFTDKTGAPGVFNCIPIGNIAISAPASVPKELGVPFVVIQDNISVPNSAAITYTWSAPDFLPASWTGTSYTPTAPANTGTYPVTLTARSTGYCDKTITKNVAVLDCLSFPSADIYNLEVSATEYCEGTSVTFTLSNTTLGRTYQLYKDSDPVMNPLSGTGSIAAFIGAFDGAGVYAAQVVAEGGNCAALMNGMHTVSMKSLPVAPTIIKPSDACLNGGDIVFTASDYSGALEWISDGGGAVNSNTVTFASGAATGTKTVVARSAQVHSATLTCYSGTVTQSATVNPLPGAPMMGAGGTQCGGTFSITAGIGSGGSGIRWMDNSSTVSPRIVDASDTYYAITTSDAGCESSAASVLVTINPLPAVVSVVEPSRCDAGTVTFSATPSEGATIDWYNAATGGDETLLINGSSNYPAYVTASMMYYAQARIATTGCVSASRVPVVATVDTPPTAPTGLLSNVNSICDGVTTSATLTANGGDPGSGAVYEWGMGSVGSNILTTTPGNTYSVSPNVATTYWVRLKGNVGACSATVTEGVTTAIAVYPAISSGTITSASAFITVGVNPNVTIANSALASGGSGSITYEWRRTGGSNATLTGDNATYTLSSDASNYATAGTYYFNRYAKDVTCNTAWVAATGTYTLAVLAPCPVPEAINAGSFKDFSASYSASTFVKLTDTRDGKEYTVVKIADRWIMAQNLNYQKDLTWQQYANQPSITPVIGDFWCPGGYSSGTTISTRASCDVWGALYSWETAMSFDGKGAWAENSTYNTGAANTAEGKFNHGRTSSGVGVGGRGICPPNWHVPTDNEWGIILDGMESDGGIVHQTAPGTDRYGINAGSRGRSVCIVPDNGTTGNVYVDDMQANWYYNSGTAGTDNYGFRVLPSGYRHGTAFNFADRGKAGYFWSSSAGSNANAWYRYFEYSAASVLRTSTDRSHSFSIRCIRDIPPAAPAGVDGSRCGDGTVTISASSPGAVIDWYNTPTGVASLFTGETYTPTINGSTTYYAEARSLANPANVSTSRTPVVATRNPLPAAPISVFAESRCGAGTVTIVAAVSEDCTVDWYALAGGTVTLPDGIGKTTYIADLPSQEVITYYAEARNKSTSCVSASRMPVEILLPEPPSGYPDIESTTICTATTVTAIGGNPGSGAVYQWGTGYMGEDLIATTPGNTYSINPSGTITYWVRLKGTDGACSTTITSARTFTITTYPPVLPGAIDGGFGSTTAGVDPNVTIASSTSASGGSDDIAYEWKRTGSSNATLTGASATYTIGSDAANYSTPGTYYFNRYAKDATCNTPWVAANGTYTLRVLYPCPVPEATNVGTFENFPATYSASTFVKLTDARDSKEYRVVKIANRWIMAQNLNYQKDLTWQQYANQPSTGYGPHPELRGNFWCPGGYSTSSTVSTRASCDVWGALYPWETAMLLDGYGAWTEVAAYNDEYGTAAAVNAKFNHGRTDHSGSTVTGGRGICPPNWHVPTDNEWGIILDGMESGGGVTHQTASTLCDRCGINAGIRGKSVCTAADNAITGDIYVNDTQANWYWFGTAVGTDDYDFRVLPAGDRKGTGMSFDNRGTSAFFWTSSAYDFATAWYRSFNFSVPGVLHAASDRPAGFSVRCIRDIPPAAPTAVNGSRCGAGTVTISAASSSPDAVINWYEAAMGGNSIYTGATYTPSIDASKTYYAEASAVGNPANISASRTPVIATMIPMPVITAQPASTVEACLGGSVKLSVGATNATGYQWKRGSANVSGGSGGTSATYTTGTFAGLASYTYTVVVSSGGGACSLTSNQALVTVYTPTPPGSTVTFEAFHPCGAPVGSTWHLIDNRETGATPSNTQTYKVRMMADGRVWMVQDLKFGNKCNKTAFTGSRNADQTGKLTSLTDKTYYGDCTNLKSSSTLTPTPANRGYLYDWAAAVNHAAAFHASSANTSVYLGCGYSAISGVPNPLMNLDPNACQGICPAGWHLPTGNNESGVVGEFYDAHTKFQAAGCTGATCWNASSQWEGVIAGRHFDYSATIVDVDEGYYWSSTRAGNNVAYALAFHEDGTVNAGLGSEGDGLGASLKQQGVTVRCIRNYY